RSSSRPIRQVASQERPSTAPWAAWTTSGRPGVPSVEDVHFGSVVIEKDRGRRAGAGDFQELPVGFVGRAGEDDGNVLVVEAEGVRHFLDTGASSDAEIPVDFSRVAHGYASRSISVQLSLPRPVLVHDGGISGAKNASGRGHWRGRVPPGGVAAQRRSRARTPRIAN